MAKAEVKAKRTMADQKPNVTFITMDGSIKRRRCTRGSARYRH
jgi:hypothetical protein